MNAEKRRIFLLPKTSESEAAGKLMRIPGIVEAAAINPVRSPGTFRLAVKRGSAGFFDIVELKIAKAPITHSIR